MRHYPAYKDSGVEWLGQFPSSWEPKQLRHLATCLDGQRVPLNSEERSGILGSVPYWGSGGVVDHIADGLFDEPLVLLGEDGAPFFDKGRDVSYVISGKTWVNNHTHVLRPTADVDPSYLRHALNSVDYKQYISGSTRDKLTQGDMWAIRGPFPPYRGQQAIAAYLDRETAQIDELIGEQEALLESLAERRLSVISNATDQPDVPVVALGRVLGQVRQGWSPNCEGVPADGITEWGVLKTGCMNRGQFRPSENKRLPEEEIPRPELAVRDGEIIMSRASTRELVGSAALVCGSFPRLLLSDLTYGLTPALTVRPGYLIYALAGRQARGLLESMAKGSSNSMQKLSQRDVRELPIRLPTLEEQDRVVTFLDKQTSALDALIAECRELIALLKERRSALISAAVTGKIDVRHAV